MGLFDISNSIPEFSSSPEHVAMNFLQDPGPLSMMMSGIGSSKNTTTKDEKRPVIDALSKETEQLYGADDKVDELIKNDQTVIKSKYLQLKKANPSLSDSDIISKLSPDIDQSVQRVNMIRNHIEGLKAQAKQNKLSWAEANNDKTLQGMSLAVVNGMPIGTLGNTGKIVKVGQKLDQPINLGNNQYLSVGYVVKPTDINMLNPNEAINIQARNDTGLNVGETFQRPDTIDESKGIAQINTLVQQFKSTFNSADNREVYKNARDKQGNLDPYTLISNGSLNKNNYDALNKGVSTIMNSQDDAGLRAIDYNIWSDYQKGINWLALNKTKDNKQSTSDAVLRDKEGHVIADKDGNAITIKAKDYIDQAMNNNVSWSDIRNQWLKTHIINEIAPNYQKEIATKSDAKLSPTWTMSQAEGKDPGENYWQHIIEGSDKIYSPSTFQLGTSGDVNLDKQIAAAKAKMESFYNQKENISKKPKNADEVADAISTFMGQTTVKYNSQTIKNMLIDKPNMFTDKIVNNNESFLDKVNDYVKVGSGLVKAVNLSDPLSVASGIYNVVSGGRNIYDQMHSNDITMFKAPLYYNEKHPELSDAFTNMGLYIKRAPHDTDYNQGQEKAGNTSHDQMYSYSGIALPKSVQQSAITLGAPTEFLETRVDDTRTGGAKVTHVATKPYLVPESELNNIKAAVMTADGLKVLPYSDDRMKQNLGIVDFNYDKLSTGAKDELSKNNPTMEQKLKANKEKYVIVNLNEDYQKIGREHTLNSNKFNKPQVQNQNTAVFMQKNK